MKKPSGFMIELFQQPTWVVIWVNALMAINLGSIAFLEYELAQAILGIFAFQGIVMVGMYCYFGYQKILGLAHLLWVPLLAYILVYLGDYTGAFHSYLVGLAGFLSISLVFDIHDVIQYFKNHSEPLRNN
ncbi:hypothetical protein A3715_10025 [Oleiphilus sp. HI0009]|uniref:hypothetical protein n=1 Tax=unclassified Oleiphilus TaxID=2631174 RepID=UPI0007C3D3D0|nr:MULTISPECIES: hypothetical protein [unclassified Oleiphilus]KZX78596.1 hypothetical protein A3715_10025 [Oleiphilus sp. HI0009]KZY61569.1 hypothetical protein A3738_22355 [Oleiphilus sp. HI0066]KZY66737.1 hypothetical protein A3738_00425 [Oleiphilus sp. HI0066]KZY70629.1 hypothetical protein A3739_06475 [Oleiphilus sp. HI0067]